MPRKFKPAHERGEKHIVVWDSTHEELKSLAKCEGVSMKKFIDNLVEEFKRTAIYRR